MRRRYRWLGAALLAIVLLPIIAVVGLLLWLDPTDLRDGAERSLREQTGLPLTLQGELHWSWWPLLAIESGAGEIVGDDQLPLLRWQRLRLGARWREMLNQQYNVDSVGIDGLAVDLRRDATGRGNWALLFNRRNDGASVHINDLVINDSTLNFSDQATARSWHAAALKAQLELRYDAAAATLTLTKPTVSAMLSGSGLAAAGVSLATTTEHVTLHTADKRLESAPLQLQVANVRAVIDASEALLLSPLAGRGTMELQSDSVRNSLAAFGFSPPLSRDSGVLGAAQALIAWSVGPDQIALDKLHLTMDATTLNGLLSWPVKTADAIGFNLHADTLDADRYLPLPGKSDVPLELPLKELRSWPLSGVLAIDHFTLRGVTARDARLRAEP